MPDGLRTPFTGGQEEDFAWTATPRYLQGKPQPDDSHSQTMDFRRDRGDFLLTTICRMHPLWPVCDNPLLGSQPIGLFWNLSSVLLSIFEFVLSTIEPLKVSFIAQPYVPYGYVHIYI